MNRVVCLIPWSWLTMRLTRLLLISTDLARDGQSPVIPLWFKVRVSVGEYSLVQIS